MHTVKNQTLSFCPVTVEEALAQVNEESQQGLEQVWIPGGPQSGQVPGSLQPWSSPGSQLETDPLAIIPALLAGSLTRTRHCGKQSFPWPQELLLYLGDIERNWINEKVNEWRNECSKFHFVFTRSLLAWGHWWIPELVSNSIISKLLSYFYFQIKYLGPNFHPLHIGLICSVLHWCLLMKFQGIPRNSTKSRTLLYWWFIALTRKAVNNDFEQWKPFLLNKYVPCYINHEKKEDYHETRQIAQRCC